MTPLHLRIAGLSIAFDPESASIRDALLPALRHLVVDDELTDDVSRWTIAEGGTPHPAMRPHATIERSADGGVLVCRERPVGIDIFDPDRGIDQWGEAGAFSGGEARSNPAGIVLAAFLAANRLHALHAGAVEHAGSGALLIGAAGAGKSTASVACGLRGLGYIGDDRCVVSTAGVPTVHALYASAKLNPDSASALSIDRLESLGITPQNKVAVAIHPDLGPEAPIHLRRDAPLAAIVIIDRSAPRRAEPMNARLALAALAPTAMMSALGAGDLRQWLVSMTQLVTQVPAFRLGAGWDFDELAANVADAIERGRVG